MAMTPASAQDPYCTGDQAVQFFDVDLWGDLLSDSGTQLTPGQVQQSDALRSMLMEASGDIEEALMCGGRYRPADLQALQAAGAAGAMKLAKMTATLAFWSATQKRYPQAVMGEAVLRTFDSLERLRSGESIFAFAEVQTAGVSTVQAWYEDLDDLRRSPVFQSRRMFGNRHLTQP